MSLKEFGTFPRLQSLIVHESPIEDEGMHQLLQLSNQLSELSLRKRVWYLGNNELEEGSLLLGRFTKLRSLSFSTILLI